MARLPMFPLNHVLLPHARMPLHVFEERYRVLTRRCLDGGGEFGTVLIERGSEVGGDDVRASIGTRAGITAARELPDGRWLLEVRGLRRLRIVRWLADDPHPWAEVEDVTDPPADARTDALRAEVERRLGRFAAQMSRLDGRPHGEEVRLHPDAEIASYQAAALAPAGPLDAQRLLSAETHADRLVGVLATLDDAEELLRFQHDRR